MSRFRPVELHHASRLLNHGAAECHGGGVVYARRV